MKEFGDNAKRGTQFRVILTKLPCQPNECGTRWCSFRGISDPVDDFPHRALPSGAPVGVIFRKLSCHLLDTGTGCCTFSRHFRHGGLIPALCSTIWSHFGIILESFRVGQCHSGSFLGHFAFILRLRAECIRGRCHVCYPCGVIFKGVCLQF